MDRAKILVVDDEEDLCEILKFNLEIEGYYVDTAFSAEEALKKDLTSYQLLLLDVMMGEISGFKMASILRNNNRFVNNPVKQEKIDSAIAFSWKNETIPANSIKQYTVMLGCGQKGSLVLTRKYAL